MILVVDHVFTYSAAQTNISLVALCQRPENNLNSTHMLRQRNYRFEGLCYNIINKFKETLVFSKLRT